MSTKLGHNMYAHKVSDDVLDESNQNIQSYLPLNLGKIAESDFVYTVASTNIYQRAPNLVKMYVTIRSWMSSIMDLMEPELSE